MKSPNEGPILECQNQLHMIKDEMTKVKWSQREIIKGSLPLVFFSRYLLFESYWEVRWHPPEEGSTIRTTEANDFL